MAEPKEPIPPSIGPYKVVDRLGGGGMAEVFLVENPGLKGTFARRMALKRILTAYSTDNDFREQFEDETRLLGRLHHPNIVTALDSGEHEGSYFLVMELVSGTDIGRLLRSLKAQQTRLPQSLVIYIARCIAAALTYAHPAPYSVIHRDISPQNILLGLYGEVKLADFGIARALGEKHLTQTNSLLKGKVPYMSPEQIRTPRSIDARSDLFALGVVTYQMLTGTHPFLHSLPNGKGEEQEMLWHIVNGAPAPPVLGVEPEFAALLASLLERDVDKRPARAQDVLWALQDLPQRKDPEQLLGQYVTRSLDESSVALPAIVVTRTPVGLSMVSVDGIEYRESRELALEERPATGRGDWVIEESSQAGSSHVALAASGASIKPSTSTPSFPPAIAPNRRRAFVMGAAAVAIVGGLVGLSTLRGPPTPARVSASPQATSPSASTQLTAAASRTPSATPPAAVAPPTAALESPAQPAPPARDTTPQSAATSDASQISSPTRETKRRRGSAQLFVAVIPWGNVWLDGKPLGEAPIDLANLEPGQHRIEFGQGKREKAVTVTLKPGPNPFEYTLR